VRKPTLNLGLTRNKVVAIAVGAIAVLGTAGGIMVVSSDDTADPELTNVNEPPATSTPSPTATPTPEPGPTAADTRLLPNLASQPPEELIIEVTDDGVRQLRFASTIGNTGVGPIETMPNDNVGCPEGERHASQIIYDDVDGDGQFDRRVDDETASRPAGCMLDHPDHDHWHFDAAARYVLTEPGADQPIVSADKVSFCWRDNIEVDSAAAEPIAQYYPEQDECGYGEVQGITPGWADVYGNGLSDQHLNLPDDLADGVYCLWNSADPYNLLVESDDTDNTAVTALEITGIEVGSVSADDDCDPPPGLPTSE
jgi:hypothetical protein